MPRRQAERRERRRARPGCFSGISEHQGEAWLDILVFGGRIKAHGRGFTWLGGRVGQLYLFSGKTDVLGC